MKKCLFSFVLVLWASCAFAALITYSTYIGSSGSDKSTDIDVNDNGEAFIIGLTASSGFPTTAGSYQTSNNGGSWDIFVTKITNDGSSLGYSTFLGDSGDDRGFGIILDGTGDALLTGITNSLNFPMQNAFDNSYNGNYDIFVSKISSDGSMLIYSTFLGGSEIDYSYGITYEGSGNFLLTGNTASIDFPTQNAFDNSYNGGNYDVFISRFTSDGSTLNYSTFLGGSGDDYGSAIQTDFNGDILITGFTNSTNFPTQNALDNSQNGGTYDVFVTKLLADGSSLDYSTYLGDSGNEKSNEIIVDGNGNALLIGITNSGNFPTQNAFDYYLNGNYDIFISKISSDGSALIYSTFLGGSSSDYGYGLGLDESDNILLTGMTLSSNFPVQNAYDDSYNGNGDLFITQLNSSGSALEFSTFLGGSTNETQSDFGDPAGNPVVYKNGNLYITGTNASYGFPTTNGAYNVSSNGGSDAIVASFQIKTGDLTPNSLVSSTSTNSALTYIPQIKISNLDSSIISNTTTTTMKISFNGNQFYSDTQIVPEIAPLSDSTVTFTSILPYKSGNYEVVVFTEFGGDSNTSNDTLYTNFEVIGDLAINEFLPIGNSAFDPTFTEFFEIANTTNQAVDISNWTIRNSLGNVIAVANGTTIPANSFFVFTKFDNGILNGGTPFDYFFNPTVFTLTDNSGYILVKDSNSQVVDSVNYFGWNNITQGETFERKNYKLDSSDENSWCLGTTVYGTENNKGTPGSISSCLVQLINGYVSDYSVNFENVIVDSTSTLSITLYSNGDGILNVSSLQISGSGFSTDLTNVSVLTGDSTTFNVSFTPIDDSNVSGSLEIFTNDWNTPSYSISLSGKGVDIFPPSEISNFALVEHNGTSVKLRWIATGDDTTSGTATSYEIRQSTNEISELNFASATLVSNIPTPSASGTLDSVTVTGLTSGTQYYFGIKAIDNDGNESPISTANSFDRPEITSITDVQNDNGGNVRITFDASLNDYTIGTGLNCVGYSILRKVNPNFSPSAKINNQIFETLPSGTWEVIQSIFAAGEQSYTTVVPTLADSNSTGTNEFEFLVRAISSVSPVYNSVSEVVLGYSIDNLPPTIPPNQNFTNNGNGTTTANWSSVFDSDLDFYTIWAEVSLDSFTLVIQVLPSGSGTQSETFNDVSGAISYAVGSVDINGNESLPFANR
ncbi:MAG: hypothetical protein DWQ06_03220, partial [Calditrichaeota bacterium]